MTVVVKSDLPAGTLAPQMAAALASLDPTIAMGEAGPLETTVSTSVQRPRFTMAVTAAFTALALLLCAIGLFGTLSYIVGERRQEMAVRLAVGARPGDLVRLVVGEAIGLASAGAVVGLAAAAALGRAVEAQLFETSPVDPLAHAAAALAVTLLALAAASLPALRASRTDATQALRAE
jgi:ABC-type antimicrobial peptide transport system permease subunit